MALPSWGVHVLSLDSSLMQLFQGQAKGTVQLLFFPDPFNTFLSLPTNRNQTQFASHGTLAQNFCVILISRQYLGFQTRNRSNQNLSRDLVQTSLFKSLTKLLWFAKHARNLLVSPYFSRNSLPRSLSPQMDICTSLALICIAGTSRKLKQDQSLLVLGVVMTERVQKKRQRGDRELGIRPISIGSQPTTGTIMPGSFY